MSFGRSDTMPEVRADGDNEVGSQIFGYGNCGLEFPTRCVLLKESPILSSVKKLGPLAFQLSSNDSV